jgi:hypothetical protein
VAGSHRFTVPSQPEVVRAEPASSTTLSYTEEYFSGRQDRHRLTVGKYEPAVH